MLIRYPGGKRKISKFLIKQLSSHISREGTELEYREPFFGAGGIGFPLVQLHYVKKAWINDFDPAIFSLWNAVANEGEELIQRINDFTPTVEAFFEFKKYLQSLDPESEYDTLDVAFKKLAVHQISYSGLGPMGGPLGGVNQTSAYPVDCRWSPQHLAKQIRQLQRVLRDKCKITQLDFSDLILQEGDCIIYLDPPYYVKGPELYQYSFSHEDHVRMRNCLQKTSQPWLLSYDDCDIIRGMYDFAKVKEIVLNYTVRGANAKKELLIAPKEYADLLEDKSIEVDIFG